MKNDRSITKAFGPALSTLKAIKYMKKKPTKIQRVKAFAVVFQKPTKGYEDLVQRNDGAVAVFWSKNDAQKYIIPEETIIPCIITYFLPKHNK